MMNADLSTFIQAETGAESLGRMEVIQSLWSGYGQILRVALVNAPDQRDSVVVKHVKPPTNDGHPRGWNTDRSHQRKLRSYQVETAWYQEFSGLHSDACRVPALLAHRTHGQDVILLLEDLDAAGFAARRSRVSEAERLACIEWLAAFHALHLGRAPDGLWPVGTYWHLATRPDELEIMNDEALRHAAPLLDQMLAQAEFQTLVHGDAKLANFCFASDRENIAVAAVDFQYVGGGCGMKDLAYFMGSCFSEEECEAREQAMLDAYFAALDQALRELGSAESGADIEACWRPLYRVAWADFHRFLKGWSPGHWKLTGYSERVVREVLQNLHNVSEDQV